MISFRNSSPRLLHLPFQASVILNFTRYIFFLSVCCVVVFTGCRKDLFSTDPSLKLKYSKEQVFFDSTFTQIGTSTEMFMVRNTTKQNLLIDKVYLAGGNASQFRMVVDGEAGKVVEDIEIAAGDSIYIFVEATIDPSGGSGALFVSDSVMFSYNGNLDGVPLYAAGMDAIYFYPNTTTSSGFKYYNVGNQTWVPGKPYVVIGHAVVDEGYKLTIMPGTQVHFFKNSDLWAFEGTLQVLGEQNNPVLFTGTNQMLATQDIPGQWNGIYIFDGQTDNIIRHAKIKNATIGLNMQPTPNNFYNANTPRKVTLENVVIENMTALGIYAQTFNLEATNLRVSNCGQGGVACIFGGNYTFTHCTLADYWPGSGRPNPSLLIGNGFKRNDTLYANDLNFRMYNSVVTGNQLNELVVDSVGGTMFDYRFENCAFTLDSKYNPPVNKFINIIKNVDYKFVGPTWNDYRLKEGSPLINAGNYQRTQNTPKAWFDLEGKNRLTDGKPDIGAIEK